MFGLGAPPKYWAKLRWIAGADERVLRAILLAAVVLGLWGALVGWRARRRRDKTRD